MKEDVMLALMQKNSVVTWNYLQDPLVMTKKEFLTLAHINKYVTAEISEGWLIAFQSSHNLESACASLGKNFVNLIK
jgi:hypothetical protein